MRTPHLYILPKIHKSLQDPPGRPIVSSNGAPTERISAFVDVCLKPLVTALPSYIRDTKDFLGHLCDRPPLPAHALLFTMDVVGLYNNIPHTAGLQACHSWLERRQHREPPSADIIQLAQLVLELNAFKYGDEHYLQIHGTAMGTRMAPSFANLFMGQLEEDILTSAPDGLTPDLYKRFIDDIFGIWLHGEAALLRFIEHANSAHPDITFTFQYGRSVTYLDTTTSIGNAGNIITDLYAKPTDRHQYLLPSSSHPPHIHQHLPYGLAIRIRTIVSDEATFEIRLQELKQFLFARGYGGDLIEQQFNRVRAKSRGKILSQNRADPKPERTPLVITWHPQLRALQQLLRETLPILHSSPRLRNIFRDPPLVAFRRPPNLRNILVHTRDGACAPPAEQDQPGSYPCQAARCLTCPMMYNEPTICIGDTRFDVRHHFNCNSSSVIYKLHCSNCSAVYIGETGQTLRARMNGHRHAIHHRQDTPVADHFGQATGHLPLVCIVQAAPQDVLQRRALEHIWISRFRPTGHLLNRDDGLDILTL